MGKLTEPFDHLEKYPQLEHMSAVDLVLLQNESKKSAPDDTEFIWAINQEMKRIQKGERK